MGLINIMLRLSPFHTITLSKEEGGKKQFKKCPQIFSDRSGSLLSLKKEQLFQQ